MHRFIEWINEANFALGERLSAVGTGSFTAILLVFAAGVLTSFTPCVSATVNADIASVVATTTVFPGSIRSTIDA